LEDDRTFGKWLLAEGILATDGLRRARDAQRGRLGRLDTEILDLQLMSEHSVLEALGKYHNTRTVSGFELEHASPDAVRMLTPRIATRLGVVPFKIEGKTLSVATLKPGDLLVEDEIGQQTGCLVSSFVTLEIRFVEALNQHYQAPITARYAGLVRRMAATKPEPESRAAHRKREGATTQVKRFPVIDSIRRTLEGKRAAAVTPEDSLEISAEELDLFPSLRSETVADVTDDGSVSGEYRLSKESWDSPPAPPEEPEISSEALLEAASLAMQNVEMRDDIADAMLGFCAPIFRRRMMLVKRGDILLGWRGEGFGVDESAVRAVSIPADEPSVFSGLLQGAEFWLGPLPTMPHNADLVVALGNPAPKDCYILPVRLKDRVVCFLYGDNLDEGVGGPPLGELKRLAAKASLAFQIYLMKGKIRTL